MKEFRKTTRVTQHEQNQYGLMAGSTTASSRGSSGIGLLEPRTVRTLVVERALLDERGVRRGVERYDDPVRPWIDHGPVPHVRGDRQPAVFDRRAAMESVR